MLAHLVKLLARALVDFPTVISGNWLSILLPAVLYLIIEVPKLRKGWRSMTAESQHAFWRDSKILVVTYIALFAWSVVRTVYQDHIDLTAKIGRDASDAKGRYGELNDKYQQLQIDCARTQGENGALTNQNRDQQNSINNCQTQALKLLAPPKHHLTVLIWKEFDPTKESQETEWLLLTNTTVTPFRMVIDCDVSIDDLYGGVVGGPSLGSGVQRLSQNAFSMDWATPAWTPTSPYRVTIKYRGNKGMKCGFSER